MPPWRTVADARCAGMPVSLTMTASASSAAFLCCTSKSGGTYSANITGVSGSTLTKRIAPSDWPIIISAAESAGLVRSGSARSTGIRIVLYMLPSPVLVGSCIGQDRSAESYSDPIGVRQHAWRHEVLDPAALLMQLAPILAGEIDHHQRGGRQTFVEPLARLHVAGGNQQSGTVVQAGVMSEHQQRVSRTADLLD